MFEAALALRKCSRNMSYCYDSCSLLANSEYKIHEQEDMHLGQPWQGEPTWMGRRWFTPRSQPALDLVWLGAVCYLLIVTLQRTVELTAFLVLTRFLRADPQNPWGERLNVHPMPYPCPLTPNSFGAITAGSTCKVFFSRVPQDPTPA